MSLKKDIDELLQAEVISEDTATRILNHYAQKKGNPTKRLFVIFGILGAVLIGLGIILMVAHNWDELPRSTKTILAFVPLVLGQLICGYVLITRAENNAWREGSASFLFIAVGACIALVSQIYNIMGNLSDYIFTWMLLCLPLIYLLKSSMASLFYIIGVTTYAINTGYLNSTSDESFFYWPLLSAVLPHYYLLYKNDSKGNSLVVHGWFITLSLVLSLGTLAGQYGNFMFLAYSSLFGLFYLIGKLELFNNQILRNNSYLVIGSLGTVYLLLHLSFNDMWARMINKSFPLKELIVSPELGISVFLSLLAGVLLYRLRRIKAVDLDQSLGYIFLIFIPIFIIGLWLPVSVILINLLVLVLGIWIIRLGAKIDHLGQLNFGLGIIALLVVCRFFDTDLSFITRGALFVFLGIGFFVTNYWMLKKRKVSEK